MHAPGIVNFHAQLLQWLKNRLLLTDLLTRHPEIHDIELLPPVVIAGLPRTGTTHLHNLLAARARPSAPCRTGRATSRSRCPPKRGSSRIRARTRMDVAVQVMNTRDAALRADARDDHRPRARGDPAAGQRLLHDAVRDPRRTCRGGATTTWPTIRHRTTSTWRPSSRRCSSCAGGRRWLLKSPQHLEQLPVLNKVFPGVVVVCTHRDPVPVALSMLAMLTYTARMHRSPVPVEEIAADLGRPARTDARRAGPRSRRHRRRSARSTSASTTSWPTNSASPNRFTASPANR